ncbi:MAG: hypothetical protein Q4E94_02970 [Clostridia bacterium]|nr:hypothetical protein [Clostridia bacterium]
MNIQSLYETLPIMAKGMAGIFIVTIIIVICMVLLNKFSSKSADNK